MIRKDLLNSQTDQAARQQAPNEMRVLTPEELREVVGGPEVNNGGGGMGIMTNVTSSTGG